jgi:glutaminase
MTSQSAHPIQTALEQIHALVSPLKDGGIASYIPELAQVEADKFGIALMSAKGSLFTVGDVHVPFTIQSVSKAFSYCLALELIGKKELLMRVGVEPSGDAFNAIEFDPITRRPYNPMVNAGAITVAGVLRDVYQNNAFDLVMERFSKAAGRSLRMNEAVYQSEASTGHRNRAIAHLLCSTGALAEPVDPAVDLYFRLCAIEVTAIDLANMAATLANLGQNPATKVEAFELSAVRDTLSVMLSCGMYDYSGSWIYEVGIPAKSGVGGGLIGVVSRQLGIGSYAPRLDGKGNSVQGVAAFRRLADELGLHMFDCTNTGSAFVDHLMA